MIPIGDPAAGKRPCFYLKLGMGRTQIQFGEINGILCIDDASVFFKAMSMACSREIVIGASSVHAVRHVVEISTRIKIKKENTRPPLIVSVSDKQIQWQNKWFMSGG